MVLIEICYIPTRWMSFCKLKIDCIFVEKTGLRRYLVWSRLLKNLIFGCNNLWNQDRTIHIPTITLQMCLKISYLSIPKNGEILISPKIGIIDRHHLIERGFQNTATRNGRTKPAMRIQRKNPKVRSRAKKTQKELLNSQA